MKNYRFLVIGLCVLLLAMNCDPPLKPNTPANLSVSNETENSLKVTWLKSDLADSYELSKDENFGGAFTEIIYIGPNTVFIDSSLTPGKDYYYRITASNAYGYSPVSAPAQGTTILLCPTNFVIDGETISSLDLHWSAVSGADEYQVFRDTSQSGNFQTRIFKQNLISFTDKNLIPGTNYYYKIKAVHTNTTESPLSSTYSGTTLPMPVPIIQSVGSATSSKLTVVWSTVNSATIYDIHRATTQNGTYSSIGTTSSTSYENTPLASGTQYFYKVRAGFNSSNYGNLSSAVGGRTLLPAPTNLTVGNETSTGLVLSWSAVSATASYRIRRSASEFGTYNDIGTASTTSYTDTGLSGGTVYYYKALAIDVDNAVGDPSAGKIGRTLLSAPTSPEAKNLTTSSFTLSWLAVANAYGYRIEQNTSPTGPYSVIGTTASTSLAVSGLASGVIYYFRVQAVDAYSRYGDYSPSLPVQTKPSAPAPLVISEMTATSLQLNWSASTGATNYKLYRALALSGPYTQIGTSTSLSFTDTGLNAATHYFYQTTAYTASSLESSPAARDTWTLLTKPGNFKAGLTTPRSITLSWDPVSSATSYVIKRDTIVVYSGTALTYTDTGLVPGTRYMYHIQAVNANTTSELAETPGDAVGSSLWMSANGWCQSSTNDSADYNTAKIRWYPSSILTLGGTLETQVKKISGYNQADMGLVFYNKNSLSACFVIDSSGWYGIYDIINGIKTKIFPDMYYLSSAIYTGTNVVNTLKVTYTYSSGTYYAKFYINNIELDKSLTNSTPIFDGIGVTGYLFAVSSQTNEVFPTVPQEVHFRQLQPIATSADISPNSSIGSILWRPDSEKP